VKTFDDNAVGMRNVQICRWDGERQRLANEQVRRLSSSIEVACDGR